MTIAQAQRQLRINTPLGKDKLLIYELHAKESLGELFEYHVELLSEDDCISLDSLLGEMVEIELDLIHGDKRYFNAFVSSFTLVGVRGELFHYQASLRPWTWFLTLASDCRIYQNLSVPQILRKIFDENGFSDYELQLSDNYPARTYCVQFQETDFNFISRLMEEEGIYYYFQHKKGKHTLVLCDSYASHTPLTNESILQFEPDPGVGGQRKKGIIRRWRMNKSVQSGSYAHTDYDFTKPRAELKTSAPMPKNHPHSEYELFEYPGRYKQFAEGEKSAKCRIEGVKAQYEQLYGEGDVRHFTVGALFTLKGHPLVEQNREYLITEVSYDLMADPYIGGSLVSHGETYRCEFTCIPGCETYRSLRRTKKPKVDGPQTAIVVGPIGDEICTDEYGRVKVQFHWDRYGELNENSSCWVRVAQVWAGKNWGAMHVPRIGQEVIVEFLDGDPDHPIITGRVYNAEQMPPWDLPASQTQSGILSRSSKTGSAANANAIRFEDKKGEEQLWLHAEKDQLTEVEHDETKWVGNDRNKTIDGNETTMVHKNRTESVDLNENISIGINRTEKVGQNEAIAIGGSRSVTIGGNKAETIALAKTENIGLAKALTIGAAYQVSVGASKNQSIGLTSTEQVGLIKQIQAGKRYELKVGKSSLVLNSDGTIFLQGEKIKIIGSKHIEMISDLIDLN